MSPSNVCFILGAGASKPYGYPLGWQLKERIIQYCLSPPPLYLPRDLLSKTQAKLKEFAHRFDEDDSPTVDAFLKKLPKDHALSIHGRMAVVAVLGACEHAYDPKKKDWWYDLILPLLKLEAEIRIVTFNYDRSLEYFLSRSLERTELLSEEARKEEARKRFNERIDIAHVYGCLARLPYFQEKWKRAFEYGALTGRGSSIGSKEIDFIWDPRRNGEFLSRSKQWILESDYVIALGFGFHHTNLNLIGLDNLPGGKSVFSSGFRLAAETRNQVRWTCAPAKFHFASENATIAGFLKGSQLLGSVAKGEPVADAYARLGPGAT